jgi:3-oxoacyl-[acyl-carrier-protein] synthase II
MGVSFGSSAGTPSAIGDFGRMMEERTTRGINATTYIKMMAHTAPVNIGVFFGLTGRVITTSSACTSGSQGIGYAYEAIKGGQADRDDRRRRRGTVRDRGRGLRHPVRDQRAQRHAAHHAASVRQRARRPGDRGGRRRLILEEREHALARGATIYAELVGFGTNSDGTHVTQPNAATMKIAMQMALQDANLAPEAIGYVNAHGTATQQGDMAETQATSAGVRPAHADQLPEKLHGPYPRRLRALEAWFSIEMMREGWFAPTINLNAVDPQCGELDYIRGEGRRLDCEYIMSNNFAFGGINTSLIFLRSSVGQRNFISELKQFRRLPKSWARMLQIKKQTLSASLMNRHATGLFFPPWSNCKSALST